MFKTRLLQKDLGILESCPLSFLRTGCTGNLVVNDWSGLVSMTVLLQRLQECLDFCFVGFSRRLNQEN